MYSIYPSPGRIRCSPSSDLYLEGREVPPLHYSFKVEAFSKLSQGLIDEIESDIFQAGDYDWKIVISLDGQESGNISIYLELVDSETLPPGRQVNAVFNLFVLNQHSHQYFSYNDGRLRCFHGMKTRCGYPRFMALSTFTNPINGFLVDDACIFGAENFVHADAVPQRKSLSVANESVALPIYMTNDQFSTTKYTWKIKNFSKIKAVKYRSEPFQCGNYKWYLSVYPKGNGNATDGYISLYLKVDEPNPPSETRLFVKYSLRMLPKPGFNSSKIEHNTESVFSTTVRELGWAKFMEEAVFKDKERGYLVGDSCTFEAELKLLEFKL